MRAMRKVEMVKEIMGMLRYAQEQENRQYRVNVFKVLKNFNVSHNRNKLEKIEKALLKDVSRNTIVEIMYEMHIAIETTF